MSVTTKNTTIAIPHTLQIGALIYMEHNMSPLMRRTVFGKKGDKLKKYKNVSINSKLKPGYFHFSSPVWLSSVLEMEGNTQFSCHLDHRTGKFYKLTSLANLRHSSGCDPFKAYRWSEDNKTITFVYNQGENYDVGIFFLSQGPSWFLNQSMMLKRRTRSLFASTNSRPRQEEKDWMMSVLLQTKMNFCFSLSTYLLQLKLM